MNESVFDVLSTGGDTYLGGEDFDARIIEWLVYEFAAEHEVDLRKDEMALQRMKDAAEKAKCELSSVRESEINLPFIYTLENNQALHLQRTLTRDKLEELVEDLVQRTLKICEQTLQEAGVNMDEVDEVILVGGMTRMPRVQAAVAEYFGREPSKNVHPDEVVALGAAIQAHALMDEESEVLLLDVTPHSLGIGVYGGGFQVLIERNSTVPISRSHEFTTVKDNQTSVKILVLQGESSLAQENELLGEFILTGLRRAPAGEVEVEVTFEISADGIVSVSARDLETGLAQSITVTATSGLQEEEIEAMIEENADYLVSVKQTEDFENQRASVRRTIREVEKLLPTVREVMEGSTLGKDALKKAQDALDRAKEALEGKDLDQLVATGEALNRTYTVFQGIVQRMQ